MACWIVSTALTKKLGSCVKSVYICGHSEKLSITNMYSYQFEERRGAGDFSALLAQVVRIVDALWVPLFNWKCHVTAHLRKRSMGALMCLSPFFLMGALPPSSYAQPSQSVKQAKLEGRWQWATADQTVLRIIAMDSARQQVVVKVNGGELLILKRGDSVPQLAVSLVSVSGSTAIFRPLNVPGKNEIDRISVIARNGVQTTDVAGLIAPNRSIASGWRSVQ